ncbi:CoA transferase [Paenarthrobacter sp. NPDC089714]|uniref:CoA transferase n=1 Tax=Paenarthrobacter sp. NPDC089714 TaxID=3364377 RepID=UPI0037FF80AC
METVPDLSESLRNLGAIGPVPAAAWDGPRRWWHGPLDVEGLAIGSVQAAATALNALTASRRYQVSAVRTAHSFDSLGHLRIDGRPAVGFAPLSGFRRTSDGWIRLHANYPHHAARLLEALSLSAEGQVAGALLDLTALEAEALINAGGGVAAAVRSRAAWIDAPGHGAVASLPWIDTHPAPGPAPAGKQWRPSSDPGRPLLGLRVLDLTRVIAGPTATRLLGALGADVLRIDPPQIPELPDAFIDSGFDKRSAVADFGNAVDLERVRGLAATADVVVLGYRAGALESFGLDAQALAQDRGDVIVAALSAWGAGPWGQRRGFDSLVQAASGIAAGYGTTNDGGWRPGALPVQALDHATGYGLAAAVLALLAERQANGRGGVARMSLARTAEELFRLGPAGGEGTDSPLPEPDYRQMDSTHGVLRLVGPPLTVDGSPLGYSTAPVTYGSSEPAWLSRP